MLQHGVDENLRFLILEVSKQLDKTRLYLEEPSPRLADGIGAGNDYIDNLKRIIQQKCFSLAAQDHRKTTVDMLEAAHVVASNLERIADYCENVVGQVAYIEDDAVLDAYDFDTYLDEVAAGVARVERAFFDRDVELALRVCRSEDRLDKIYGRSIRELIEELKGKSEHTQTLITLLFMAHYFERMGDALLNVGEAIISACLGEKIKIGQFQALADSLEQADVGHSWSELAIQRMGETRSGCRIDRVFPRGGGPDERAVIFKEGRTKKLREEERSIARWEEILPGLAPKVHSFHDNGDFSAILFEYLHGYTLEDLLVRGTMAQLDHAMDALTRTLREVWDKTRTDQPARAGYMDQLLARLQDVYTVHPRFTRRQAGIGPLRAQPIVELARRCATLEEGCPAPFSVFIHGDFNVDNVIFDPGRDELHFIDLHRSRRTDYVQDVTVFLVSNFRLQGLNSDERARASTLARRFYDFARAWAEEQDDRTFQLRAALGVARSFATSTRFVLDRNFAKEMLLRARYLLERVAAHDEAHPETFQLMTEAFLD